MRNYPGSMQGPFLSMNYGADRQFFVPFLTGALLGGAAVGITRPRPIYNVAAQPQPYPPYAPYPYPPYARPYTSTNYQYQSFY